MATRKSAKADTALNTNTVETPAAPIGHNNPPSDEAQFPAFIPAWDYQHCARVGLAAYADKTQAKQLEGSSIQRCVASIMGFFALWSAKGHHNNRPATDKAAAIVVPIYPLSGMASKDEADQAKIRAMRALLMDVFSPAIGKDEFKALPTNEKTEYRRRRAYFLELVNKGLRIAAILFRDGITVADFDETAGVFSVYPSHVIAPGYEGAAKLRNQSAKFPLDNASVMALKDAGEDAEMQDFFFMSVERVVHVFNLKLDPNYNKRTRAEQREAKSVKLTDVHSIEDCKQMVDASTETRVNMLIAFAKYMSDADVNISPGAFGRDGYNAMQLIAQCWSKLEARKDWQAKVAIMMKATPAPATEENKKAA